MANEKIIPTISIDPTIITNPAGKITKEEFLEKYGRAIRTLDKFIPEVMVEREINQILQTLRSRTWGLSISTCGTKSLTIAVQTPILARKLAGTTSLSLKCSYKIDKRDIDLSKVSAAEKKLLLNSISSQGILTGAVPSGYTLFRSVSNCTSSLDIYGDADVRENHLYIYRLYINNTNQYIQQVKQLLAVSPTISSFTGTPDPLVRKVKFTFEVDNVTKVQIFKGSSTTALTNNAEDTAVQHGNTYTYTLKVTNDWGRTVSKAITVRCTNLLPSKPTLSITKDAAYVRNRLAWGVQSNVSSCKITRSRMVNGTASATSTFYPSYNNGYYYDSGVTKGYTYSYTMTATNGWGSTASAAVSITMTGSAPAIPSITSLATDRSAKVTVKYTQSANATSYKIYRSINGSETLAGTTSTISYYDSSVTKNEEVTYRVSAVNGWGESAKSAAKTIFAYPCLDGQIKRKALCIATKFNERSLYSCKEMAKAFQHNGIAAEYVENLSKTDLANKLKTFFDGFDADDYPIIMCNAHGSVDRIWLLVENNTDVGLSYADFKKMLDKVPGHKILLIDACHSGSAITSNAKNSSTALRAAFSMTDLSATIRSVFGAKTATTGPVALKATTKSAELATSDYSVICSATPDQSSWGRGNEYNYIPYWWSKGLGWDFLVTPESCKPCRHHADTNNNKAITVAELTEYSRVQEVNRSSTHSDPFCWPANDNKVIAYYTSDNINGIRYFSLKNSGIFLARLDVKITDPTTGKTTTWKATGTYSKGKTKTVDLSSKISKAGTKVKLVAFVKGGKDKTSREFYYHPDSTQTASFEITGTTLSNKLKEK